MPEGKLNIWNTYQSAWSDLSADDRRALLAKSVAENCIYSDPANSCEGVDDLIANIERSQAKVPGARFHNDRFLDHHDQGLSDCTMFDGKGKVVATGTSYARFGSDGRLTQMTGFFEPRTS